MLQNGMLLAAAVAAVGMFLTTAAQAADAPPQPYFSTYAQQVEIVFRDDDDAAAAQVRLLPLYDGRDWAISCRWDDNTPTNIRMMRLMDQYGIAGTFYMNGREQNYWGPRYDYQGDLNQIDRLLVASGRHSIGGHGLRHPSLPYLNRHALFEQILRVRADREASSDTPLCSYGFSNMVWKNELDGPQMPLEIAEALFRAGFYHNANVTYLVQTGLEFPASKLLPWDGATAERLEAAFAEYLADEKLRRSNPNITFSMHAAVFNREPMWEKLEGHFRKYGRQEQWWYCNQNQYAAYRLQFLHTKLTSVRDGRTLRLTLERPVLRDLNDPVPLTLEIAAVPPDAVQTARSGNARVEPASPAETARYHVHHDASQRLPAKIGWIANDQNRSDMAAAPDADWPDLRAWAWRDGDTLRVRIVNGGASLEEVALTRRVPPPYGPGRTVRSLLTVGTGKTLEDALELRRLTGADEPLGPVAFFGVQVDFVRDGVPGRLHLTVRAPEPTTEGATPAGQFVVLGPIASPEAADALADAAAAANDFRAVTLPDGKRLAWRPTGPAYAEFLHPDALFAEAPAAEHNLSGCYLLAGIVASERPQTVRVSPAFRAGGIRTVYVNGRAASEESLTLDQGDNALLIVFGPAQKRAILFRLLDPASGERASGLRFRSPAGARQEGR